MQCMAGGAVLRRSGWKRRGEAERRRDKVSDFVKKTSTLTRHRLNTSNK